MCTGGPSDVTEALDMLERSLGFLATADAASLPSAVQADALRALGRAEARHTVARARVLGAFSAQGGYEDDGHGSARAWLKWQTRISGAAAVGAVGWVRRLAAHPVIERALGAGELSPSWARAVCAWTDRLPEGRRGDADAILAGAAGGGAGLVELGGLAREMWERCCRDGTARPEDDRFEERWFRLGITFRGAGRAEGDLTPGCAAALAAVLEALEKKAGPEDTRTHWQRRHDALEEACRRLIRAGMVPARAGQPTQVLVHMSLRELRGLPGASAAEASWAAARISQPGWLTGPEADAAACDATLVPVVTGHVDWAALDRLAEVFQLCHSLGRHTSPPGFTSTPGTGPAWPAQPDGTGQPAGLAARTGAAEATVPPRLAGSGLPVGPVSSPGPAETGEPAQPADSGPGAASGPADATGPTASGPGQPAQPTASGPAADSPLAPLSLVTRDMLRRALLGLAADALSGPDGLAARLRAALDGRPLTSASLPLDIGAATETIPAHLRRAATTRHPCCAFPGCDQPAPVCDIHHLIPRARGGPTALHNLVPLCGFHHLTAIHRWGWALTLHPDGTTTATSPDGRKTLHSHGPPSHGPPSRAA